MCNGERNDIQNRVVEIVLHEYDALREEVLSHMNSRFQLLGLVGIAATLLGVSGVSKHWHWVFVLAIATLILLGLWLYFGFAIKRCAVRLRQIEEEINSTLDRQVLKWERELPRAGFYSLFR
jgi:sulfite exporter TauE/SafE